MESNLKVLINKVYMEWWAFITLWWIIHIYPCIPGIFQFICVGKCILPLNTSFFFSLYWSFSVILGKNRQSYPPEAAVQTPRPASSACSPAPFVFFSMNFERPWIQLELKHSKCQLPLLCRLWIYQKRTFDVLVGFFFLLALLIVLNIWLSRWLGMFRTESVTYWSENLSSWTWLHDQHELFYLLWGNLKY